MLLGSCIAKWTYYLRVAPPSSARQVGRGYDEVSRKELEEVRNLTTAEFTQSRAGQDTRSTAWAQAQLPIGRGGCGLRSQELTAAIPYLGSLAQCLQPLWEGFPELHKLLTTLRDGIDE